MFYERERGTTVYSGRPTTWSGKVALMYPSDYGYATSGGVTTNRDTCLATALSLWEDISYVSSDCNNNDWLFNNAVEWTLMPFSSNSSGVFCVGNTYCLNYSIPNYSYEVRPSVYLSSNVLISGGSGTINDPYVVV